MDSYYKMISRAQGVRLFSLDTINSTNSFSASGYQADNTPSAFDVLRVKEMKKIVARALSGLPEREQLILVLYYYEELTLKEIAKILGVTESRVSQLHSKAIMRLRVRLRSYHKETALPFESKRSGLLASRVRESQSKRLNYAIDTRS